MKYAVIIFTVCDHVQSSQSYEAVAVNEFGNTVGLATYHLCLVKFNFCVYVKDHVIGCDFFREDIAGVGDVSKMDVGISHLSFHDVSSDRDYVPLGDRGSEVALYSICSILVVGCNVGRQKISGLCGSQYDGCPCCVHLLTVVWQIVLSLASIFESSASEVL